MQCHLTPGTMVPGCSGRNSSNEIATGPCEAMDVVALGVLVVAGEQDHDPATYAWKTPV